MGPWPSSVGPWTSSGECVNFRQALSTGSGRPRSPDGVKVAVVSYGFVYVFVALNNMLLLCSEVFVAWCHPASTPDITLQSDASASKRRV